MRAKKTLTRRDLLATTAKAGAIAAMVRPASAQPVQPAGPARPVAISSLNGLAAVKLAVEKMVAGVPPVDAAVAGIALVGLTPTR